jgi:hypothetical protein
MRIRVKTDPAEQALTRILNAFAQELIGASDAEILEAAKDLGMDPDMKGSAAFLGVIHATPRRLSDFFDAEALQRLLMPPKDRLANEQRAKSQRLVQGPVKAGTKPKRGARRARPRLSSDRKPSNGK